MVTVSHLLDTFFLLEGLVGALGKDTLSKT